MTEVLVKFFGGPQDGHFIPLPEAWDVARPPGLVWLHTEYDERGYTRYRLAYEPSGVAYRHCGGMYHPVELHYERFEQADEPADLHSG